MPERSDFPRELVLASSNAGKLRELSAMLQPLDCRIRPQSDWAIADAVEDGHTFIENALIKARHAALHTGLPSLGDDSGLVVSALKGAPGIFSSRFAGAGASDVANNKKLLQTLEGVSTDQRGAHFYCAMALLRHAEDPAPIIAVGTWPGLILEQPRGEGGFGYDPLFWLPRMGCSSAELPPDEKNRISHRGQALIALLGQMKDELGS